MSELTLVFPNQLFMPHPAVVKERKIVVVEDSLFFGDRHHPVQFHKAKLAFHRATMNAWAEAQEAEYIDYDGDKTAVDLLGELSDHGATDIHLCEVVDDVLERRLKRGAKRFGLELHWYPTPMFLSPPEFLDSQFEAGKKPLMANFYQNQRRRMGVLMDSSGKPVGGKWSYDADNRKKLPKKITVPFEPRPEGDDEAVRKEAVDSIAQRFADNPGNVEAVALYPTTPTGAERWLKTFLQDRFAQFGDYEDAISREHRIAFHSVLTPMLNVGLLTPQQVVDATLKHSQKHDIPLNSLEGFLRQIIGWREFMMAIYQRHGVACRNGNFWEFDRPMPACFYDGTSGIAPIDDTIHRVLDTSYCHHIERLMLLGSFFLLCEIRPDDVYRWFMEMFIDAYDWVMVPNVYGMSQFADGGFFTTKPYICGSNYVKKMSDYPAADWCPTWDGLYWTFIDKHQEFFRGNPRLSMMPRMLDKMDPAKLQAHRKAASNFLEDLS